jgi:Possible hemagglutinin (DUF637)/Hemagglutinin repeat/Pre-toxin domain with VENN motif
VVANAGQGGKTVLQAGNDVNIAAVTTGRSEATGLGSKNGRTETSSQAVGSVIRSGGDLRIEAGRDITAQAASLQAGSAGGDSANLSLYAGRNLTLTAGENAAEVDDHLDVKGGLNHFTSNATSSQTTLERTTLDAGTNGQVKLHSGADMTLAAIEVNAQGLSIDAGGSLNLQTHRTHSNSSSQHSDSDVMFLDVSDNGRKDQSTHYNQFNVQQLSIHAGGAINAQMSVRDSAQTLAQQPGMEWINRLTSDPTLARQLNWQQVQEAHDKWDYSYSGLSPSGAAIVSIIVGAITAGASSTVTGFTQGAMQAGYASVASQATVSFYNNTGDIGAVLKDLGSNQGVKNIVGAMLTGGALGALGNAITLNVNGVATPLNQIGAASPFMDQLGKNLINGAASAVINTAVNGGSLEDNLAQSIASAFINTAAAQGAYAIGGWQPTNSAAVNAFARETAHAILGCAAGAARAGSGDGCAAGAAGSVAGHLVAQYALTGGPQDAATMIGLGQVVGGIAGALVGDDVASVNIGAQAGGNAVKNNQCAATRSCGSSAARVNVQGNVAAEPLGRLTTPTSLHLSIEVTDGYSGITVLDGQPRPGGLTDSLGTQPQIGVYCVICLNSNISSTPKENIVWGPFDISPPIGMTTATFANSLIQIAGSYNNNTLQYTIPALPTSWMGPASYNSNSWAAGILQSTTGTTPLYNFAPFIAPGYQNPIPRMMFSQ